MACVWLLVGAGNLAAFFFLLERRVFQVQQDLRIRLPDVWPGRVFFHFTAALEKCKTVVIKKQNKICLKKCITSFVQRQRRRRVRFSLLSFSFSFVLCSHLSKTLFPRIGSLQKNQDEDVGLVAYRERSVKMSRREVSLLVSWELCQDFGALGSL